MSAENVFDFLAYLRSLTPEQRAIQFQLAEQRYCWHCGGPQGACECGWPKVEDEAPEPAPRVTPNQQSIPPTGAPAPEEP